MQFLSPGVTSSLKGVGVISSFTYGHIHNSGGLFGDTPSNVHNLNKISDDVRNDYWTMKNHSKPLLIVSKYGYAIYSTSSTTPPEKRAEHPFLQINLNDGQVYDCSDHLIKKIIPK